MSQPARFAKSQTDQLPKEILELSTAIGQLPADVRQKVDPIMARLIDSTKRRRRILNLVQDALSQLRLDMRYMMFDLEATRRERDDYRHRLEES